MFNNRYSKMVFLALVCLAGQRAFAYGALAIDTKQGAAYGWAINQPSPADAEKYALDKCGQKCQIVMRFTGGAAAYVADQTQGSTIFAWGRAPDAATARQIAMEEARVRGAKDPLVRVWGQESAKPGKAAANDSKVKVFVVVKLALNRDSSKPGSWARFVGWTMASPAEIASYGETVTSPPYADGKKATYFFTPSDGGHSLGQSPVMQRFVKSVVEKHPLYAQRSTESEYYRGVEASYSTNNRKYMAYDGQVIMMDPTWTYDELKNVFANWELRNPGYDVIDAGEF